MGFSFHYILMNYIQISFSLTFPKYVTNEMSSKETNVQFFKALRE